MQSSHHRSFFENKLYLHKTLCRLGLVDAVSILDKRKEFIDKYSSYPYSSFLNTHDFQWTPHRSHQSHRTKLPRTIPAPREIEGHGALSYHIPEKIYQQRSFHTRAPEILLPIHSQNMHDMSRKSKEAYLRARREFEMSTKIARISGRMPLPDPPPPKFQIIYSSDRKAHSLKKS